MKIKTKLECCVHSNPCFKTSKYHPQNWFLFDKGMNDEYQDKTLFDTSNLLSNP